MEVRAVKSSTVPAILALTLVLGAPLPVFAESPLYRVEVVNDALEHPWSLAFLPDGRMLVTERPGRLRIISADGTMSEPVSGLPPVFASGQSGLLEVLLAQDYEASGLIYLSFVHGDSDANATRIVSARLDGEQLVDVTPIFTASPLKSGDAHAGGRMAWLDDGTLVMGLGDGFYFREAAQKLDTHHAKIIRINADGSVPADNPFVGQEGVLPEIYSYGHRHVQALVTDRERGLLYSHEHGPRGGDELNIIWPGLNYGWPVITYGRDYSRAAISPFTEQAGMEQPLLHWTPSIAPAGMTLYDGALFPQWQGDLFVAALAEESVRRVSIGPDGQPEAQEMLFTELDQRMRDVRTGPDGALYLLTDEEDGQLLRVVPAQGPADTERRTP
jgi:aldose sugar dehydrogenase